MKLFWEQGYNATSLSALLGVMGIARSSFYASFGDKRSLFIECLELFAQRTLKHTQAETNVEAARRQPISLIHQFFETTVRDVPPTRLPYGCLLVNSVLELADTDDELAGISASGLAQVESAFAQLLKWARDSGEWKSALTPDEAARYLMTINQGVRVQCRKKVSRDEVWSGVENALSLVGIPISAPNVSTTH